VIGRGILGFDGGEYLGLVEQFPPVKIRTPEQAKAPERRIEELLAHPKLSAAEEAYVDLVSDLLADWEDATVTIPDIDGVELLRALLEDRGLRQKDLVGIFATESVASEVIAGRRELSRKHIEGLARFFKISPAVFFPADGDMTTARTNNSARRRKISRARRPGLDTRRTPAKVHAHKKPGL